jgi:hypothetical protein
MKNNAGTGGLPSRRQMVALNYVVRVANCGLGYERFSIRREAHLHHTQQPNALPTFPRYGTVPG